MATHFAGHKAVLFMVLIKGLKFQLLIVTINMEITIYMADNDKVVTIITAWTIKNSHFLLPVLSLIELLPQFLNILTFCDNHMRTTAINNGIIQIINDTIFSIIVGNLLDFAAAASLAAFSISVKMRSHILDRHGFYPSSFLPLVSDPA